MLMPIFVGSGSFPILHEHASIVELLTGGLSGVDFTLRDLTIYESKKNIDKSL